MIIEETVKFNRKIRELPTSCTVFYGKKHYVFANKLSVSTMEKLIQSGVMGVELSKEEVMIYALGEAMKRTMRERKQENADIEAVDALVKELIKDLQ